MDPCKSSTMTGDPNQKSPPSVFGFEAYPQNSLSWDRTVAQGHYGADMYNSFQMGAQFGQQQASPFGSPQISNFPAIQQGISGVAVPQTPPANPMFVSAQINPGNFNFGASPRPQDNIVQFPFQITSDAYGSKTFTPVRGKRKTDSPPLQPCKQHITEEKMAEHLAKLHISSETVTNDMESEIIREKRLYMCEEMRKLQTEPIVPQCLLSRMESPCKALVLWRPPVPLLPNFEVEKEDDTENNNEENVPDGNTASESEMENVFPDGNMDMDA